MPVYIVIFHVLVLILGSASAQETSALGQLKTLAGESAAPAAASAREDAPRDHESADKSGSRNFVRLQSELLEKAFQSRDNAYAPFSHYYVGAAVATPQGIFTGANIENPNRRLNAHAEQVATWKAVAAGAREILAMSVIHARQQDPYAPDVTRLWEQRLRDGAVLSHKDFKDGNSSAPCGMCRQGLLGFAAPDKPMVVLYGSRDGALFRDTLDDLLPSSYIRPGAKQGQPQDSGLGKPIVLESRFPKEDPASNPKLQQELLGAAESVLQNSYIPYPSKDPAQKEFKRAAAVLGKSGKIYLGVSVFYTPAISAEEAAVFSALSEGERDILAVAVKEERNPDAKEGAPPKIYPDSLQVLDASAGKAVLLREQPSGMVKVDSISALTKRLRD